SSMTTMNTNGRVARKSLASQLDRLDGILDALSDGLNEAVATAVQEAVGKAVEVAFKEVLSNSELLRTLLPQAIPIRAATEPKPKTPSLKERLQQASHWLGQKMKQKAAEA